MNKIVLVTMVKNEADIIESFVRHSLTFADEIIVADHMSNDRTREILASLLQEGLPLTIHDLHEVELAHGLVMTKLMWEAIEEHGADIVLPADADEFLVNTETEEDCRAILGQLDTGKVHELHWRLYEPLHQHEGESEFLLSRPCKRGQSLAPNQKCIVGARAAKEQRFQLTQGCHYAFWGELQGERRQVPMEPVPFIHAAHFHWRSDEQYASKVATSWLNNVAKYTVHTPTASYLKGYFEKIRSHERVEPEGILKDAENFDLRPFVQEQILRYSGAGRPDVLANLMAAGEQVAQSYAEYKTLQKRKQVSFVVPYLGDYEAWEQALEQAVGQTYPYREILVPVLRGEDEQVVSQRLATLEQEQTQIFRGDVWGELSAQARGDYVQWVLPGVEYCPEQAVRLISCLESQDYDFLLAVSNGRREFAAWSIYYDVMDHEPISVLDCKTAWQDLLCLGKQPSAGLSGAMIKRKLMEECGWLREGFLEGQPLLFAMWRILLMSGCDGRKRSRWLGVVHGQYVKRDWQNIEGEAWLWHQLEWVNLLELDGTMLTQEQLGRAYQGVTYNWELLGYRVREMPGVNR
ncbi:MAG: glycosyltransferase family 2 protein, partial [Selenomonas sp.]|nr:glycosyltransferase family 2 protein [Selenomonas sp.]